VCVCVCACVCVKFLVASDAIFSPTPFQPRHDAL
jgi:hypothetical protein